MTRGVRNNNPLNIRLTRDKWVGLCKEQTDKEFCQFTDPLFGFRAAFRIIHNRFKAFHVTEHCVLSIVSRWAPPSENDTNSYVQFVCSYCGVSPREILKYENVSKMCDVVRSMAYFESRCWYDVDLIRQAYFMEQGK